MKKITMPAGLAVEGLAPDREVIIKLKPRKTLNHDKINQLGRGYILQGNEQENFGFQSFSVE